MFAPTATIRSCLPVINPVLRSKLRPHRPFRQTSVTLQTKATSTQHQKTKWLNFRAIITRWVPLGSVMYVGWCYIRASINCGVSNIEIGFYERFPFRVTSRLWGKVAAFELPVSWRNFVYGFYVKLFNVNLEEAACPDLSSYKSLSAFFTRGLREGVRFISPDPCVSPCDGTILNCGPTFSEKIEQVKGVTYSLEEFLGDNCWSKTKEDNFYSSLLHNKEDNILYQCIIYLAPGDYHRFHSPCNWTANFRRHFSGKLLSVNPIMAKIIPGLFSINERAVYVGEWKHGFFSMTAVGATNVGSIEVYKDPELQTNKQWIRTVSETDLKNVSYAKGELFGQFNMGSTIILLFEAPKDFEFDKSSGERVKVGESLFVTSKKQQRR